MFMIQEVTGGRREDWEPWGEREGYGSRKEAAEDLTERRPVGTFRIVEERSD